MTSALTSTGVRFPDNSEQTAAVPIGAVVVWTGLIASIPTGWYLCDGTSGTPDLRDRFIVGAGSSYTVGDTGGSSTVLLTAPQIAAHTHTSPSSFAPAGVHDHTVTVGSGGDHTHPSSQRRTPGPIGAAGTPVTNSSGGGSTMNPNGAHSHTTSISPAGDHLHTGTLTLTATADDPHENRPPYYAVAYIIHL
jgi:microcystin-dependent protein